MRWPRFPRRYLPTNKWWVQFVTTCSTIAAMLWTGDGINTDDEKKALIGLIAALLLTYAAPNTPRPPAAK